MDSMRGPLQEKLNECPITESLIEHYERPKFADWGRMTDKTGNNPKLDEQPAARICGETAESAEAYRHIILSCANR
jgi:hypothetical protein